MDFREIVLNAYAIAGGNTNSKPRSVVDADNLAVEIFATGLTHANGTVTLQESSDGETWFDRSETATLSAGSSNTRINIIERHAAHFIRAAVAKGTNTGGTVTIVFSGR